MFRQIGKHLSLVLAASLLLFGACQKLDEDGGYYDEESKTYKYLRIKNKGVEKSPMKVFSPTEGKPQHIQGTVTRIEKDGKNIWLKIEDRHPYMILAERLSGGNRNDKDKELQITLQYVSPYGSVTRGSDFRKKWMPYVLDRMREQLVNQTVLVEIEYEEGARKLWGTIYRIVQTEEGEKARNINLWMVQQGLSYYFIDHGKASEHKRYLEAQNIAKQYKNGIWKYQ